MQVLDDLTRGTWRAQGDGFTSTLTYRWRFEGRLLEAANELTDAGGKILGRYFGSYAWDPGASEMVFWTMAESGELHRGRAMWREGTLWHEATVSGGRITTYASALRWQGDRMEYFADYAANRAGPELLQREPLEYRRVVIADAATGPADRALEVRTASGSALEERGREQLLRLVGTHDVDRWMFTRTVQIRSRVIPHSHPVLTLNTQYIENDTAQLATLLHEQFHWYVSARPDTAVEALEAELRRLYPNAPAQPPDGANGLESTYLHLIVCTLEYEATAAIFGRAVARRTLEQWRHYTWVYRTILDDNERLVALLARHGVGT